MGTLLVRGRDAARRALDDQMDVALVMTPTGRTVPIASAAAGNATVRFKRLIEGRPHVVESRVPAE